METWIFTHGDTDGICCGALAKATYKKAKVWISRPVTLTRHIQENTNPGFRLIICDIAVSEYHRDEVFNLFQRFANENEVIYVDHHPLPPKTKRKDIPATTTCHDLNVSSSELFYKLYRDRLDPDMARVFLYGAIGDYSDQTIFVRRKLESWDRRTIYMEAGLLTQALGGSRGAYGLKKDYIEALAEGTPPSEIKGLVVEAVTNFFIFFDIIHILE